MLLLTPLIRVVVMFRRARANDIIQGPSAQQDEGITNVAVLASRQ